MNPTRPATYICRTCRSHLSQARHFTSSASSRTALDRGYSYLSTRRLLSVHGQDAAHFLQGLTTQNIPTSGLLSSPSNPQALYSAFMNAQGRLLHDVFIYPLHPQHGLRNKVVDPSGKSKDAPAFLVEVDAKQVDALRGFLRKYRLRAKVEVRAVDEREIGVWGAWAPSEFLTAGAREGLAGTGVLVAPDTRVPGVRSRVLAAQEDVRRFEGAAELGQVHESVYTAQRYLEGVPEGQAELPREETLLHEANVDLMQGVDFRKGCYVGQELVIRTQHTGVVRKRVMPMQIWTGEPPSAEDLEYDVPRLDERVVNESRRSVSLDCPLRPLVSQNIKTKGAKRPEGRFLAGVGNLGLGLFRLEKVVELEDGLAKGRTLMFEIDTQNARSEMQRTWVRPFVPSWWKERGQIMEGGYESLKARSPGRKI